MDTGGAAMRGRLQPTRPASRRTMSPHRLMMRCCGRLPASTKFRQPKFIPLAGDAPRGQPGATHALPFNVNSSTDPDSPLAPSFILLDALASAFVTAPGGIFVSCKRLGAVSVAWYSLVTTWLPTCTHVDLSSGFISDAALLDAVRCCPAMQTLRLSRRSSLADPEQAAGGRWHRLQATDLAACVGLSDATIAHLVARTPLLTSLDLSSCSQLSGATVASLATACPKLRDLDLSYCTLVDDAAISAVARGCSWLRDLDLTQCSRVSEAAVSAIAEHCPSLVALHLGGFTFADDAPLFELAAR